MVIFVAMLCQLYYHFVHGDNIEIEDFSEDEIQKIQEVYDLQLNDNDEIVSISYMSLGIDSFYVLKIKPSSVDEYCVSNQDFFPVQKKLKTIPFLFSCWSYVPKGVQKSLYYSDSYVYISTRSYADTEISDLYFEIEDNR